MEFEGDELADVCDAVDGIVCGDELEKTGVDVHGGDDCTIGSGQKLDVLEEIGVQKY